jgi:hypothetical protein
MSPIWLSPEPAPGLNRGAKRHADFEGDVGQRQRVGEPRLRRPDAPSRPTTLTPPDPEPTAIGRFRRSGYLGAVNFDALPLPDISFEVRVPLCLLFKPGAGSGESGGPIAGHDPRGRRLWQPSNWAP